MWKQTLSSKLAIIGLFLLIIFLGDLKFKQWLNQRAIEKQEQDLKSQADQMQQKNDQLSQSLQFLNSPDFKEKVARQQLGYKLQGETVYSFADNTNQASQASTQSQTPNYQKWWSYFFEVN